MVNFTISMVKYFIDGQLDTFSTVNDVQNASRPNSNKDGRV